MSDSDTSAIDSKKTDTTDTSSPNYSSFLTGLLTYSIHILVSFVFIGSIGLYTCKIAQANVLPDNISYAPFGDKIKDVEEIPININIVKEYGFMGLGMFLGQKPKKEESTKIFFNIEEITQTYENGLIGFINSLKSNPERASYFGLYFSNLISPLIVNNNWIINKIFGFMNQYINESFILLLYPIILPFLFIFLLFFNMLLAFFYQLKNWSDFFMNKSVKNNKVTWNDPMTYFRPWRWFLFILYCFFLFFPVISFIPLITSFYSIFSPLGLSAKIADTDISIGFLSFMKDVIMYKSQLYLILLTFGLLSQASINLGTNGIIGCIVGIIIVMFSLHLYNQVIPTNNKYETSGLVSSAPAKAKTTGLKGGKKIKSKK